MLFKHRKKLQNEFCAKMSLRAKVSHRTKLSHRAKVSPVLF